MATKPLILAIEPDRRQASAISSVARRISVELLLVESVAEALTALRKQLPDLILTPTLLPCRDDARLTERLRELGDAATHIQRLTIPLFEAEAPGRGRVLSTLRREKRSATAPVGCKAETFAEQLTIYLKDAAAAHRKRRRARHSDPAEPAATAAQPEAQRGSEDPSPVTQQDDPSPVGLPASDAFKPAALHSTLTPLPIVSLDVEPAVSAMDALPLVPEAVYSLDALMAALASNTVGGMCDMLVPTPPVAPPAITELPAICASGEAGALASDAAGSPLIPAELAAIGAFSQTGEIGLSCLPEPIGPCEFEAPELFLAEATPPVDARVSCLPEPIGPCELEAPEPSLSEATPSVDARVSCLPEPIGPWELEAGELVLSEATPSVDARGRPRQVTPAPKVTPNERKRRKMMRRKHAHTWTASS